MLRRMADQELSFAGVGARFGAALAIVFATFNPEGVSYYHWALRDWSAFDPLKGIVGVVLLIGWAVFLRATSRSLGPFGFLLAVAFFGMLVWALVYYGVVVADSARAITYLAMFVLAGVLTAGMVWSIVRRRISGQVDVDEADRA